MALSPSAHVDSFTRDSLPPASQWPTFEFTLPELQYPDRLNAGAALIDRAVERFGADRPALIAPDGTRWNYGELQTRANQVAQVLAEDLGLLPGNRVLLRSPNNPWTVAAWLGVLKAGGVVVTTMHALRAAELEPIIAKTKPSVALVDHRFADDVELAFRSLGAGAVPVVRYGGEGADDLTQRAATKSGVFDAVPTAADDVALLGPTSVSTGVPKITMQFHLDILATAPTAYRAILKAGRADLLAGVKKAVSAGEHLPQETWHHVHDETGLKLINGIGATELLHVFISAAGDDIIPGATGRAVPGYRATILDAEGNEASPGELGRLAVIGPTGCRYLSDERQLSYVVNGWNVTGDTFYR
ncbi:MAG: AMP-binding protein, partial [Sinomonas sp.]|nr:AMP-binding protein [Sinomonas sp.]